MYGQKKKKAVRTFFAIKLTKKSSSNDQQLIKIYVACKKV